MARRYLNELRSQLNLMLPSEDVVLQTEYFAVPFMHSQRSTCCDKSIQLHANLSIQSHFLAQQGQLGSKAGVLVL